MNNIDFKEWDKIKRTNFLNSLSGVKSPLLIGTQDVDKNPNLALFSNVFHVGANPALMGLIHRPIGDFSHTYKNIKSNLFFTINHLSSEYLSNVHQTSARWDKSISEFETCGLKKEYIDEFNSPFVKEAFMKIGLKLVQEINIELNNTILLIGSVEYIALDDKLINEDGNISFSEANALCVAGLGTYFSLQSLAQLNYAKPS